MTRGSTAFEEEDYAGSWDRWFGVIETGAKPVSRRLLEAVAVRPGCSVLDLATGLGEPALTAAAEVAPDGRVLAVDFSAAMLKRAEARAARLGAANIAFRQMDLNDSDLPANSFDAVLCRWGLMFLADLDGLLAQVHRSLVPGGRFAAAVWAEAERVPAIGLSGRVVRRHLGLPPPEEGPLSPFACADRAALEARLGKAGFIEVGSEERQVDYAFDSATEFVAFRKDLSGPLRAEMTAYSEAAQATAWQALAEAVQGYADAGGHIRLTNTAVCVFGRKPG